MLPSLNASSDLDDGREVSRGTEGYRAAQIFVDSIAEHKKKVTTLVRGGAKVKGSIEPNIHMPTLGSSAGYVNITGTTGSYVVEPTLRVFNTSTWEYTGGTMKGSSSCTGKWNKESTTKDCNPHRRRGGKKWTPYKTRLAKAGGTISIFFGNCTSWSDHAIGYYNNMVDDIAMFAETHLTRKGAHDIQS